MSVCMYLHTPEDGCHTPAPSVPRLTAYTANLTNNALVVRHGVSRSAMSGCNSYAMLQFRGLGDDATLAGGGMKNVIPARN
jgi:hypothetical protein